MSIPLRYGTTLNIQDLLKVLTFEVSIPLRYGTTLLEDMLKSLDSIIEAVSIPLRYGTTAVFSYYY